MVPMDEMRQAAADMAPGPRVAPASDTATAQIDLNADLGEGFGRWSLGDDAALMRIVTSANIACGFHAGDPMTMRRSCELALQHGVRIGAHVSYRDLAGFGRRPMDVPPAELAAEVLYQIAALDGIARSIGTRVAYVKPHGALYNAIVHDTDQAAAVVEAIRGFASDQPLAVMGLPGSQVLLLAEQCGLPTLAEAFADRAYTAEGTLVSRRQPGAVLSDPEQVARRVVDIATTGTVQAIDGSTVKLQSDSLCVHGDTPGALAMATAVREALTGAGVRLAAQ